MSRLALNGPLTAFHGLILQRYLLLTTLLAKFVLKHSGGELDDVTERPKAHTASVTGNVFKVY